MCENERNLIMSKYIALIPAYKPEELMLELLPKGQEANFEIVIVDDGSGEEFAERFQIASEYGKVISYMPNQGKGHAMKTGFEYIRDNFPEDSVIVTIDADGQHKVEDALKICRRVEEIPDALVLGSRKLVGEIPLRSRFGNSVTRFVYQLSTGLKVHDTQTGLRACHASMIPELLAVSGERYEFEMRVLLEFARKHITIEEIEIETIYINDNSSSHFNPLKDSFKIYKEIFKFSAASLISFVIDYLLFTLFTVLTLPPVLANVLARVISGTVNFCINREFVFKSKGNILKAAIKYILLAAFILAGNTALLWVFVNVCHINEYAAKIITEVIFFAVSWVLQKCVVFKKK